MPRSRETKAVSFADKQTPAEIVAAIEDFLTQYSEAAILENGKVLFDLRTAKYSLNTDHGRATLHMWSEEQNTVRRVVSATLADETLRLTVQRMGQAKPSVLEIVSSRNRRTPNTRDATRTRFMRQLERVLAHAFPEWKADGFRTAMDLERSFGPAYSRGSLIRGRQAWAVIGVNEHESPATIDGILTLGILWLQTCRERGNGRPLYQGLKLVVPRGAAALTQSRLAWMNHDAAQWKLYELDSLREELTELDPADTGNLRTRLVHRPDENAAEERFRDAVARVVDLAPAGEHNRIEQRLRSSAELAFLLHGLEFARARIMPQPASFAHKTEITVGAGADETALSETNREALRALIADLFQRRRASSSPTDFSRRGLTPGRRIGAMTSRAAHSGMQGAAGTVKAPGNPSHDPLYRMAPERWLESMLRLNLAPLTRGLAADVTGEHSPYVIPRLDPRHVYPQVPAIVGAGDRGLLDLLGVTADGRLAVIELKADDDLHFALQGLDYWIRVRHHHLQTVDPATGLGEFQRHGYFRNVELSPLPPRLYLIAPALHIHPATETVLRYLSPHVEWHLLALDERWREQVRVLWRKASGDIASKSLGAMIPLA